ncbi:MAG: response regulator transcription factor [Dactylosporangium sp.]|nr:hypothetical protein [Dactylosporangium sp.]NNJ63615.1 response regulator transcription factor [Dactylosporangium sp.]
MLRYRPRGVDRGEAAGSGAAAFEANLNDRERDVLRLLAEGLSNTAIAQRRCWRSGTALLVRIWAERFDDLVRLPGGTR